MPRAWTCKTYPELHGSFLQAGLQDLSRLYGVLQPAKRLACPVCMACGEPGWMRPAEKHEEPEVARLATQQQEA